jgi:multidrug resistance efflux pump
MTSASRFLLLAMAALLHVAPVHAQAEAADDARRVMLSGVVRSSDAETIYAPMSNSSPVVLRQLAPDGVAVKPGDVLVRIDPGAATAQINALKTQIALAKARIDKERAELDVRRVDAALALVDAEAALAKAEVDAAIPADYLARIDYDRYQGEAERARREIVLKRQELASAEAGVQRRVRDGALEVAQLEADLVFAERQIARAEQRATRAGTAVFGFHPWSGQRFEVGASANPGMAIGEVVGAGELAVRAWVLEVDRPGLRSGQAVQVRFDALPGRALAGRIASIAGAPEPKAEWGSGRYFTVDVTLEASAGLPLKPGMSARIEAGGPPPAAASNAAPSGTAAAANTAGTLRLEGEIAAARSDAIAPPAVENQWQYQVTQMAPDGSRVKAGDVVVAFDGAEVQRRLQEAESKRREKRSERERLLLDLAERERTEALTLEEQRAERIKAERKTEQPAELLRSVEYRKLVIDRSRAEQRDALFEQRYAAGRAQRAAERVLVEAELTQLETEVATLGRAVTELQVKAPRDGILVLRTGWRGERFEVGSQVFIGQAVAEIPDPATLLVRATAPERELMRLAVGATARVRVEGGAGRQIDARVTRIGSAVRNKSRRQPIPVIDVELSLEGDTAGLRPGQAVGVELDATEAAP